MRIFDKPSYEEPERELSLDAGWSIQGMGEECVNIYTGTRIRLVLTQAECEDLALELIRESVADHTQDSSTAHLGPAIKAGRLRNDKGSR